MHDVVSLIRRAFSLPRQCCSRQDMYVLNDQLRLATKMSLYNTFDTEWVGFINSAALNNACISYDSSESH